MICSKCNREIPDDSRFCPLCRGLNDGRPNFCKHCGAEIEADMDFCTECGKPVEKLKPEKEHSAVELPAGELVDKGLDAAKDLLEPQKQSDVLRSAVSTSTRSSAAAGNQTLTRAPATVRPAEPTVPHSSVTSTITGIGSKLGEEAIHTGGEVVKEGAKKAGGAAKTVAISAAVVAFIIGAIAACLNFFVSAPDETVTNLCAAVEEMDYEGILSCVDSKTEKQIRAIMGVSGDLFGSLTGISVDFEDLATLMPSVAPDMETPDLGIAGAETVLYADCSQAKLMEYYNTANNGGDLPDGYLSDNSIVSFLQEYDISIAGLENLIAECAIVKITLTSGDVGYLPLINEGWGDWRLPIMELMGETALLN